MQQNKKEYRHDSYREHITCMENGGKTLLEAFVNVATMHPDRNCFGCIVNERLNWFSFYEALEMLSKLNKGLKMIKKGDIIGIFSINRYEWILSEQVVYTFEGITCPLYSTFGLDSIEHVLRQTEMETIFISGEKADFLYENVLKHGKVFNLKHLIVYDDFLYKRETIEMGINVHFFCDIIEKNNIKNALENAQRILKGNKLTGDDLATICYTSGTSGLPKGVELTHSNFISTMAAFFVATGNDKYYKVQDDEVYLSYLPLAHVMERVCINVVISAGASVGFYRGDIKKLAEDYKIIRPTFIAGVPRVFNLFKENISAKVAKRGLLTRLVFAVGLRYKYFLQRFGIYNSWIDNFIFSKVATEFGGKMRACLCGSAPIEPSVLRYLQAALSVKIFQGYGSTETCAASIVQPYKITSVDTVGVPFPQNVIKLHPCEEESYRGKFEIRVKGSNVFRGYYKNQIETENAFDECGWFKTGDLGTYEGGCFKIVGRKKEIFKTSQGEYISPEKIEGILKFDEIDDILVVGKSSERFLIAYIVCLNEALSDDRVIEKFNQVGNTAVEKNKLMRYEIPRIIKVLRNTFSDFGDVLTPTLKKKRAKLEKLLENTTEALYDTGLQS